MKKFSAILAVCLAAVLAASCGKSNMKTFGGSTNGIYLFDDLSIKDVVIEDFDAERYDVEEFKECLLEEIAAYNKTAKFNPPKGVLDSNGNVKDDALVKAPVTLGDCVLDSKKLNLQLVYANVTDYTAFNESDIKKRGGTELQVGTMANPDPRILTAALVNEKGERVEAAELNGKDDFRFMLCDFEAILYGDGGVYAYSEGLEMDKSHNCVSVPQGTLGIVIFK